MIMMMSGLQRSFNKSAKRNFHQRESHDEMATIYYYSGKKKKEYNRLTDFILGIFVYMLSVDPF